MKKTLTSKEMVERRNKKYGKKWLKENASKAGKASAEKRKKDVKKLSPE